MRTTRKVLVLLAIVAVMVAALVVCSYAAISYDPETNSFPGGSTGEYKDVYAEGWVQLSGGNAKDANGDGDYDDEGDLYKSSNGLFRAYFNESKGTLVIDMATNNAQVTGGNTDYTKNSTFAYWCANVGCTKVTTLEIRDVGSFNNAAYVWGKLTGVKTIKLNDACTTWNGTKSDTGAFAGLKSLDTLLWGSWDKTTGEFTKTRGSEGVVDLGGFIYLDILSTTYNSDHYVMYAGSAVRATGVKKVIFPYSQVLKDANRTYSAIAISDGTFVDGNAGTSKDPNSNYGKTIASGKVCSVLKNKTTGETGYTTFWAVDTATWEAVKVKAAEDEFGGNYTGIIPYCFAYNATKLEEVTIPAEVTLEYIEALAFAYCSSLKTINVLGSVSSDLIIEKKDAFTGVTGLTINVTSERSKLSMQNALSEAGVTGVTVVNLNPPEQTELDKAIVADGYSIRMSDENAKTAGPALRAEFTLKESVVGNSTVALEDFGVVVFSANTFKNVYGSNIYDIYDAVAAGTDTRIIRKSAKNGPYVKIHDNGDITFAAAITNIPAENYASDIYTYAYAVWSDGTVTYTTYTSERTGKTAHALYDLTMYLFKNGLVNSENMKEELLWGVISTGAVAYEGKIRGDQKSDPANYTNATHYLDNPLFAYANYQDYWSSTSKAVLEETSSTNINWSILVDGDEYVVVYRNAGGDGEAMLPGVYPNYTDATHPYSSNYNRADAKTPALANSEYQKIKTVVIDYGIDGVSITSEGALSGLTYVTTIVYPNGFDEVMHYKRDWKKVDTDNDGTVDTYKLDTDDDGDLYDSSDVGSATRYLLRDDKALKDIIWANHDSYAHMEDFIIAEGDEPMNHLFDMRGMGSVPVNGKGTFDVVESAENIVFGTQPKRLIYENLFGNVKSLYRVWYEKEHAPNQTYVAPLYKTYDIHATSGWGELKGNSLNVKSNGYTLILNSGLSFNVSNTTFFGGDNADSLTVKVIIEDTNGTVVDPTTVTAAFDLDGDTVKETTYNFIELLVYKLGEDTANRIYVYRTIGENNGKYVNAAGNVYSE